MTTFGNPPEDPKAEPTPAGHEPANTGGSGAGTLSPDGRWVWDGQQWQPTGAAAPPAEGQVPSPYAQPGPYAAPGPYAQPGPYEAPNPYAPPGPYGQYGPYGQPGAYGQYGTPMPMTAAGPAPGLAYGGFWIRVVAYLIDSLVIGVVFLVLGIVSGGMSHTDPNTGLQTINGSALLLAFLIPMVYLVAFWGTRSQTPGMMAFNMRIVRAENGAPIDLGKAIIRYIGYVLASFPFGLGLLWAGFDSRKQGWHDKIANTFVVRHY